MFEFHSIEFNQFIDAYLIISNSNRYKKYLPVVYANFIESSFQKKKKNIQTTIRYFQQSVDAISILLTIIFIFKDSEDLFFWIVDTFNLSVDKIIDIILLNMLDQVQTPSWGLFSFVENRIRAQTLRIIRSIFNFCIEISLGWVLFLFETTQVKVFPLYVISFFTLLNMKFGVLYNI